MSAHTKVTDEVLAIIDTERSRYKVTVAITAYIAQREARAATAARQQFADEAYRAAMKHMQPANQFEDSERVVPAGEILAALNTKLVEQEDADERSK